jgi:hypothetical protein
LIEAARYVTAHHAYAVASLLKVAQRLGRTAGSATYYFSTKKQAISDTITSWHTPQRRWAWLAWFHLLAHAASGSALGSLIRPGTGNIGRNLSRDIQCQRQSEVRSDFSPELLADQLMALHDG